MTYRTILFAALAVGICAPTLGMAERAPTTISQDARVRQVNYNSSDVIRIDTHSRVNTAIELGAGERINQVLLGDSESYEVNILSNRNTVSIKPVIAGMSTNMTIYTNRRAIAFYLREGRVNTHTYRVVVNFPSDRPRTPTRPTGLRDAAYQVTSGSGDIKPLRIWNDGTSTFFEFRSAVRPSIFGLNSTGYEVTQNSASRGTIIRLNGVRSTYTIRLGDKVVCVVRATGSQPTSQAQSDALRAREF